MKTLVVKRIPSLPFSCTKLPQAPLLKTIYELGGKGWVVAELVPCQASAV